MVPNRRKPLIQGARLPLTLLGSVSGRGEMTNASFLNHRQAALALLNGNLRLTRKAGQFLGQITVDPTPMSKAQADWLAKLLDRAGLPNLAEGSEL